MDKEKRSAKRDLQSTKKFPFDSLGQFGEWVYENRVLEHWINRSEAAEARVGELEAESKPDLPGLSDMTKRIREMDEHE